MRRTETYPEREWDKKLLGGPQPIARFKVWATPRSRPSAFFWVTIWKTLQQAHSRMQKLEVCLENKAHKTAIGACFAWDVYTLRGRKKHYYPELGEIVLALNWCRVGVISHECLHAAHSVVRRIKRVNRTPDTETPEERLCIVTGDLVMQTVRGWQKHCQDLHGNS